MAQIIVRMPRGIQYRRRGSVAVMKEEAVATLAAVFSEIADNKGKLELIDPKGYKDLCCRKRLSMDIARAHNLQTCVFLMELEIAEFSNSCACFVKDCFFGFGVQRT